MRINRFVLDNNIWVSYFTSQQQQKIVDIIRNNDLALFSCIELEKELTTVLNYPHLKKYKVNVHKSLLLLRKVTVHFTITYPIRRYIPADANDDYIVALALQTNSGFITSGDSDILSQKEALQAKYKKLKILTKAEFETMFGDITR